MVGPLLSIIGIIIFAEKSNLVSPYILPNYISFGISLCFILAEIVI